MSKSSSAALSDFPVNENLRGMPGESVFSGGTDALLILEDDAQHLLSGGEDVQSTRGEGCRAAPLPARTVSVRAPQTSGGARGFPRKMPG